MGHSQPHSPMEVPAVHGALTGLITLSVGLTGFALFAMLLAIYTCRRGWPAAWILGPLLLALPVMAVSELIGIGLSFSMFAAMVMAGYMQINGVDVGTTDGPPILLRLAVLAFDLAGDLRRRRKLRREGLEDVLPPRPRWVTDGRLDVGEDERGRPVRVPLGDVSGSHTLTLGATGSGKSIAAAWMAGRMIEAGCGAIVIDPKGDRQLQGHLRAVAERERRRFLLWSPEGPYSYNPYGHGSDGEVADKALAGEVFTEPHYLRQAQRYLGHAVRTIHAAGWHVTAARLAEAMDPQALEAAARRLGAEDRAQAVHDYLDSLTDRQRHELAGVRDRLCILTESEVGRWLDPMAVVPIDLAASIADGDVVCFDLQADRRPLLASMIASAILVDLATITAEMRTDPHPTAVVIDEFSAIPTGFVSRLFARSRDAGISLILATQELADLAADGDGALREQVLGNASTILCHRQNVPASAEMVSQIAGTEETWITTQQTQNAILAQMPTGQGSRRRGHEYIIHPTDIKRLPTGQAAVILPGSSQRPAIAKIHHPREAEPRLIAERWD